MIEARRIRGTLARRPNPAIALGLWEHFQRICLVVGVVLISLSMGCSRCRGSDAAEGTSPESRTLPPLIVRDDTPRLHLTCLKPDGNAKVALNVAEVPEDCRELVRIVSEESAEGHGDLFYVADLREKLPSGEYQVRTMPRTEWEELIRKRRATTMEARTPQASPSSSSTTTPGTAQVQVVVYAASWCGACRSAEKFLRSRGIKIQIKDIEKDPSAGSEMQAKLKRAGLPPGGSIPVIDIRGKILVGFDQGAIDRALRETQRETVL